MTAYLDTLGSDTYNEVWLSLPVLWQALYFGLLRIAIRVTGMVAARVAHVL